MSTQIQDVGTVDTSEVDVPYLIKFGRSGHNTKIVHLPSEESTRDTPETCCKTNTRGNGIVKDPAVYPPGYRRVCKECVYYHRNGGEQ